MFEWLIEIIDTSIGASSIVCHIVFHEVGNAVVVINIRTSCNNTQEFVLRERRHVKIYQYRRKKYGSFRNVSQCAQHLKKCELIQAEICGVYIKTYGVIIKK